MATPEFLKPQQPGGIDFQSETVVREKERPTLACTKEAVSALDQVFERQLRTSLWPHNVAYRTIDKAAEDNPSVNSHYTVVRAVDSQIITQPYNQVFAAELAPAIYWLEGAARTTGNHRFKEYLRELIKEFARGEGNHERAVEAWLSIGDEPYVDFLGGAIDRYLDRRKIKFYFQGATGTLNRQATKTLQDFTRGQLEVWRDIAPDYLGSGLKNPKVRVRVDNTERFGGLAKRMRPSANNLPCEPELRERYGSKIVIFFPSLLDRLINEKLPIMNTIIPVDMRRDWTREELEDAGLFVIGAHEPSHSIIRRDKDEKRFGNMYAYVNEMYATLLGLAIVGMRTDIDDDTKNRILAVQFATFAYAYAQRETDTSQRDYLWGFSTIFNTLIESRVIAIDNEGRIRWDEPDPVYRSLVEPRRGFEDFISHGNREMALRLKQVDGHLENFRLLRPFRKNQ